VFFRSRFFHQKKCGAHNFRSRQNAATLFPLRICSEISLRHLVHAFLLRSRCVIAQLCYAMTTFSKMWFT
jgi:hypothetical protein